MILLPLLCCHGFWHSVKGLLSWHNTEQRGMMHHKTFHYNWETFFCWNLLMHFSWHVGSRSWKETTKKKKSFLNKWRMNLDRLKDFHSEGTGGSSYSSFYLWRTNRTEGICQLRVRLFCRHTHLSQPHIPKDWLGFMSDQNHPEHPSLKAAALSDWLYLEIHVNLFEVKDRKQITGGWGAWENILSNRMDVQRVLCNLSLYRLGLRQRLVRYKRLAQRCSPELKHVSKFRENAQGTLGHGRSCCGAPAFQSIAGGESKEVEDEIHEPWCSIPGMSQKRDSNLAHSYSELMGKQWNSVLVLVFFPFF